MRKVFVVAVMLLCLCLCSFAAPVVEPYRDIHEVIGGLYALASVVDASGNIGTLSKNFVDKLPDGFEVKRVNNAVWVGVPVKKLSGVRGYLRSNSKSLKITDSPEGHSWMSGDSAWLMAGKIVNGKLNAIELLAARSQDSGAIFFSTQGQDSWWLAFPELNRHASELVLRKFGVSNAPELHEPSESGSERVSIYDSVRPSPVRRPGKIHVGGRRSDDVSIEMGDVIFNPIPGSRR